MQVAYIMKKAVFLRIVLTAAVLALLLSGCRFVRVEEEERKPVDYIVVCLLYTSDAADEL